MFLTLTWVLDMIGYHWTSDDVCYMFPCIYVYFYMIERLWIVNPHSGNLWETVWAGEILWHAAPRLRIRALTGSFPIRGRNTRSVRTHIPIWICRHRNHPKRTNNCMLINSSQHCDSKASYLLCPLNIGRFVWWHSNEQYPGHFEID